MIPTIVQAGRHQGDGRHYRAGRAEIWQGAGPLSAAGHQGEEEQFNRLHPGDLFI